MEDIIRIPLTKGYEAIIDAADWELVKDHKWYLLVVRNTKKPNAKVKMYAQAKINRKGGQTSIYLHRLITDAPKGMKADHRDGDGMNNRRANLRVCTNSENVRNSTLIVRPNKTSLFKGVGKTKNGWSANIACDKQDFGLGTYDEEIDAAMAYDQAARKLHGEFAMTNEQLGLIPGWIEEAA